MLAALRDPALDAAFGVGVARFRHDFADRDDLEIDHLAEVTPRLPMSWVFANVAQRSAFEGRGCETPIDCTRVGEYLRDLDTSDASIRVYNLERIAEFRDLARQLESLVRDFVGDREGGLSSINLGLFAASPGSVTPAHPDRHHNLLFELRGRKQIWLEDDLVSHDHHVRVLDYLRCPSAGVSSLPAAQTFVLEPGDGVYIPPYTYHWTEVFEAPALAFSIGFSTPGTIADSDAHELDLRLRRLHLRPRPTPAGSWRRRAKAQLGARALQRSARKVERRVSVSQAPGGQS